MVMIRWTGLAQWNVEFPFPGNLTSTFLYPDHLLCFRSRNLLAVWGLGPGGLVFWVWGLVLGLEFFNLVSEVWGFEVEV